MSAAPAKKLLTLPEVASTAGLNLDRLRDIARSHLEPAGLVARVGPQWVARAEDVEGIAQALDEHQAARNHAPVPTQNRPTDDRTEA